MAPITSSAGWQSRAGWHAPASRCSTRSRPQKARVDFVRQLHDREALLPREQQRRFLESEGWIAWSGPAISELLKQFIAHNRMMTGGFAVNGQMVTLTDITCRCWPSSARWTTSASRRPCAASGGRHPNAEVYEAGSGRAIFGLVVGSKAAQQGWPTVAAWVEWLSTGGTSRRAST